MNYSFLLALKNTSLELWDHIKLKNTSKLNFLLLAFYWLLFVSGHKYNIHENKLCKKEECNESEFKAMKALISERPGNVYNAKTKWLPALEWRTPFAWRGSEVKSKSLFNIFHIRKRPLNIVNLDLQ